MQEGHVVLDPALQAFDQALLQHRQCFAGFLQGIERGLATVERFGLLGKARGKLGILARQPGFCALQFAQRLKHGARLVIGGVDACLQLGLGALRLLASCCRAGSAKANAGRRNQRMPARRQKWRNDVTESSPERR